jgi:hypothetical protein
MKTWTLTTPVQIAEDLTSQLVLYGVQWALKKPVRNGGQIVFTWFPQVQGQLLEEVQTQL